jgi:hypothetical protein
VATRAQRRAGAFAVRLGPGHQQPHGSHRREEIGAGTGPELVAGVGTEVHGVEG